ncbi:MAG: oligosaccharide flippase family protein [bacterium]
MTNQRKAGIMLSYMSMFLNILIGFIYVPVLLHFLGKSQYGLYQLMGSLIAYMAIMDFGLSGTITRYYSRYLTLEDKKNQANILALSSIIYGVITLVILLVGFVIYLNIDIIFSNSLTIVELGKAKIIFAILLFNTAITIPSYIFNAVINSHEKFVFIRVLTIIQTLLKPFVVVAILLYRADVIGLVIVQTAFNIAAVVAKIYYSLIKLKVKVKLYSWDKGLLKEMIAFSFFIFLNMIVDQIYWKTDQIILGIISGTSAVAVYSIASQLDAYYIRFSSSINSVFLPKISAISAETEDMTELNKIFRKIGRIQFAIMALILTGFILYGKNFIGFWAGNDFRQAYYMALIVMVPLLLPLIQNMGLVILQAKNKHAFRSKVFIVIAILNIVLTIPLARLYGGFGCAIATSFALIIGNFVIMNIYYHKKIGLNIIAFAKEIVSMSYPVLLAVAVALIANLYFPTTSVISLLLKIGFYIVVYFVFMWFMGLNSYEKDIFHSIIARLSLRGEKHN